MTPPPRRGPHNPPGDTISTITRQDRQDLAAWLNTQGVQNRDPRFLDALLLLLRSLEEGM